MAESPQNSVQVIYPKDPNLPDYLDFSKLRKEGLAHIGALSGKIWTDHNVHDPGITILEVLVYALMDLGYKTNLSFKDLITPANTPQKDDNFLTPLEILTVNPATITDYRKLLLELKGVRNAWLEPTDQETPIYIDQRNNKLVCRKQEGIAVVEAGAAHPEHGIISRLPGGDCILENKFIPLHLNGLYKVYIEKDTDVIQNKEQENNLLNEINQLLAAHRNLCEDFKDICLLNPLDIGICAEVEIETSATPVAVYAEIIKVLKDFIQPQITYYTLRELLDKQKTIDEIFAGRPFLKDSFGFVDTEELEGLQRRKVIYLSDLYTVILGVEGVLRVKKIHINGGTEIKDPKAGIWVKGQGLQDDEVPVFSLKDTCIDLYSQQGFISLDKRKIHQGFTFPKKFHMPASALNCEVPTGRYLEDLGAYESIQNDFPVVYGIGPDGLPERASLKRQTQALQLKGFLLFYDQLLSNYTAQLSNLRALFSLKPEGERTASGKKTYFTQLPESVPGLHQLLRFYENDKQMPKGTRLALPVACDGNWDKVKETLIKDPRTKLTIAEYCDEEPALLRIFTFSSPVLRDIYISQLADSFFRDNYTTEILTDRGGYFFVLRPGLPAELLLVGVKRYKTYKEAINHARSIAFLCALRESYNPVSDSMATPGLDQHYFNLNYSPIAYIDVIQGITENSAEYSGRRTRFLDHLLARFGEEFTDYTILHYQNSMDKSGQDQAAIEDQSDYLYQISDLGRNRARAFNYLKESWNTENVSGYEKRISLLAGIHNYERRNLCNFEVTRCFRLLLKDWKGRVLFRSNRSYESREVMHKAGAALLEDLRKPETYPQLERVLNGFNSRAIQSIFSITPGEQHIEVVKYTYRHKLTDSGNKEVKFDKKRFQRSEKTAWAKQEEYIRDINEGALKDPDRTGFRLLSLGQDNTYVNTRELKIDIQKLIRYRWSAYDEKSRKYHKSDRVYTNENDAWTQLIQQPETEKCLSTHSYGIGWKLMVKGALEFRGTQFYPDKVRAVASWRQAKMLGSEASNYTKHPQGDSMRIALNNEKGKCIALSNPVTSKGEDMVVHIDDCVSVFGNRNTKPKYEEAEGKYGFNIVRRKGNPLMLSYGTYNSQRAALEHMGTAFAQGQQKKNYLLSGDEGNPEYSFILRDESDVFLAIPPEHFETAADRDRALDTTIRYFKENKLQVLVKEEPYRYSWSVQFENNPLLQSTREFKTPAAARADMEKNLANRLREGDLKMLNPHYYQFGVVEEPSHFGFVYGPPGPQNVMNPIFKSKEVFKNVDEAKKAYSEFAKKLPALNLKSTKKKGSSFEFALFEKDGKEPLAIQYGKGSHKASFDDAKSLTTYITELYTREGTPRERYVIDKLPEHQEGRYEWRFYKKNAPLAISPYMCTERPMAERIMAQVCEVLPPISLKECPPKKKVVCPAKNPEKYHYQVCFEDVKGHEFILISYKGFNTYEEAEVAWETQWLEVIGIARGEEAYGGKGKISLREHYEKPGSDSCEETSLIAVVPEASSRDLQTKGINIKEFFLRLANLFPIYRLTDLEGTPCNDQYFFRVTIPEKEFLRTDCTPVTLIPYHGSLLWESVDCYKTVEEAIAAYNRFCTLAGIPNNCRVMCRQGNYYVGLVEVLVESSCDYISEEEAWDDQFPKERDLCNNCVPGGVREFIYAAEDCENFIPYCDYQYWKFKVVSPHYFVVDHNCYYNTEKERNEQIAIWVEKLQKLDWKKYITKETLTAETTPPHFAFLTRMVHIPDRINDGFCEWVQAIRDCLPVCKKDEMSTRQQWDELLGCLREKYKKDKAMLAVLKKPAFDLDDLERLVRYFPVYKTDEGYCYRIYWPANDREVTKDGLQPCGCEDEKTPVPEGCSEIYPFVSSNCYSCCEEALKAFMELCRLVEGRLYSIECTEKTSYGPYSFQLTDKSKELGYNPQQYECLQDVLDAIEITKACIDNTGMHLLEHILLRPKNARDCPDEVIVSADDIQRQLCCMLPICPDYCCPIEFYPDMDKDDPCAELEPDILRYVPGSDPYSFWATLVLPAWDKRFRSEEARMAFKRLLYKEVPALVGLHILWLSPRDLCKFEEAFRSWLEWKQDPGAPLCDPNGISPNCLLTDCIKHLESEPPCPSVPGARGDCDCVQGEDRLDDECCLPPETTGSIFWGYCPPDDRPDEIPADDVVLLSASIDVSAEPGKISTKSARVTKKSTSKKKIAGKPLKKDHEIELLSVVRKRKPAYMENIMGIADDSMMQTKTFEITRFFLENPPTVNAFKQLADYYSRYSLNNDETRKDYLSLVSNAGWYLMDQLVLDKEALSKEDRERLNTSFQKLKSKGLSLNALFKNWKLQQIMPLANTETLAHIETILK